MSTRAKDLSGGEYHRRMAEIEDTKDTTDLHRSVVAYLERGVGSSTIGRSWSTNDPGEREKFADWVTKFFSKVASFRDLEKQLAEEDNDDTE